MKSIILWAAIREPGKPARQPGCYSARRGAVLVAVLVTLMVASVLLAAMLRTGRQEYELLRGRQQRMQAIELGEAALERASAKLTTDANYQQENWRVPAADLGGAIDALITISVQTPGDNPRRRHVHVEVNYPPAGEQRARHRREAWIDLSSPTANKKGNNLP